MFLPANLLGIVFALTSALVWGSGDFSGGLATRRSGQFQVLALSALSGIVVLLACAALRGESFPSLPGAGWAILAGFSGAVGLAALYRGLAQERAASVASTSAVIGAVIPVVFGILTQGAPAPSRLAGFALALLGVGLVSRPASGQDAPGRAGLDSGFGLACLAGVGFGAFFILIAQGDPGKVFTPLIVARCVTLCTALLLIRGSRLPMPALTSNPIALLAGVLDAGGNVFYLLARQFTRLDIAAVLSSLYPAATVLLAALLLKEKVARPQAAGVVVCLLAIILITA